MTESLISIIVPCYKVEKYIHNCIKSVLHQSYVNWELILIDDGSPDCCGEICDEYAKMDDRISVIHKKNGGLSSARNAGLDIVSGEYVSFLDSDDFWHPDYLKVMMGYIITEGAEIVQCGFVRGEETIFPTFNQKGTCQLYTNHSIFTSDAAKIIMCGKVYKVDLFKSVRMPVGFINEDDWTTWKLYYQAKKIVVTDRPLYYYTYNPTGIVAVNKRIPDLRYFDAYEERINFFRERGERDLEDVSHLQFCKSLMLLYGNELLTYEQKKDMRERFRMDWKDLKHSSIVPLKLKWGFCFFNLSPTIAAKLASILK
jgi:glycosyltransferase involved in cell wall biosynthesis